MFTSPRMTPNKYAMAFKSLQSLAALEPETYDDLEVRYPITNPLSHAVALLLGIWGMVSGTGSLTNVETSYSSSHGRSVWMWIYPLTLVLNIWPQKTILLVQNTMSERKLLQSFLPLKVEIVFHNKTSCCEGFILHKTSHFAHLRVFFCQHTDNLCKICSPETKFSFYLVQRAQNTNWSFFVIFEIKSLRLAMVCWFRLG